MRSYRPEKIERGGQVLAPGAVTPPVQRQIPSPPPPARAEDPVAVLARIQQVRHTLDAREYDAITALRAAGWTWKKLAPLMDCTSHSGARYRYAALAREYRRRHRADTCQC